MEGAGGSLIYAGGDDVLALLPLHTALSCADELRSSFVESMDEAIEDPSLPRPTLSVGLALVHHLEPMDRVRRLAKEAEALAKDDAGRNALAIIMKKRSGSTVRAFGRWNEEEPLHLRLVQWARLLRDEELPDGVIYEMESLGRTFEPELGDPPAQAEIKHALARLAERLIKRKRSKRGAAPMETPTQASLLRRLEADGDPIENLMRLSAELQIARLLLQARDVAWGGGE